MNNRADNLEWCTNLENFKHAKEIGLWVKPPKSDIPQYIPLNRYQVRRKRVKHRHTGEIFESVEELAEKIGWKVKDLRRRIGGERPNNTVYEYEGSYSFKIVNRDIPASAGYY